MNERKVSTAVSLSRKINNAFFLPLLSSLALPLPICPCCRSANSSMWPCASVTSSPCFHSISLSSSPFSIFLLLCFVCTSSFRYKRREKITLFMPTSRAKTNCPNGTRTDYPNIKMTPQIQTYTHGIMACPARGHSHANTSHRVHFIQLIHSYSCSGFSECFH